MSNDERDNHVVDMLLRELVGNESPPDVRSRVLEAVDQLPKAVAARSQPARRPIPVIPAKRSKLPALAVAATLGLLGGGWWFLHLQQISAARTPVLTSISGTVNRPSGPLSPGDGLSTGPRSTATLRYPDGTEVELSPETSIVVAKGSPWDRPKGIELVSGKLQAEVAPQPEGSPMAFTTDDATAVVVGTRLSFQSDAGRTRLEVTEGAVRYAPQNVGKTVLVKSGQFAEAGAAGFRSGAIPPVHGITGFTLMNADTDLPIRAGTLSDREAISLSSLPTRKLNLRADYEGKPPASLKFSITRQDGDTTGLPKNAAGEQNHPPFFLAGDHWADGRPNDCRAWTPRPGRYRFSAQAIYFEAGSEQASPPLEIELIFKK